MSTQAFARKPKFGGVTYSPEYDERRLSSQLARVQQLLSDGRFRTLSEIARSVGGSEAGVSARVRDLRKEQFGAHTVLRRRRGDAHRGIWEYALVGTGVQMELL